MLNDANILNFAPSSLSIEQKCQMDSMLNLRSSYFSAFSSECARCLFVLFLFFPFHCILLLLHSTYLVCFSSKLKVKFDRESSFDSRIISTQYERGNVWKLCLAGCVCHDSGVIFFSVLKEWLTEYVWSWLCRDSSLSVSWSFITFAVNRTTRRSYINFQRQQYIQVTFSLVKIDNHVR